MSPANMWISASKLADEIRNTASNMQVFISIYFLVVHNRERLLTDVSITKCESLDCWQI
jgi:hypothetical protein